ncbi:unnamed protein product, partial [Adineta ricciae]
MDYYLRRRLTNDLLEQAIDIERQRENELRRHFQSIMRDYSERRNSRSQSYSRESQYRYDPSRFCEEQSRHRSGSSSQCYSHHHRTNRHSEPRECSLVTITYRNAKADKHGDEIMIVQRGKTVFKGCLKRGDRLTLKSKRYHNDGRIHFEFFINDSLEDRMIACCEHSLISKDKNHLFCIERVVGSQPCHECELNSSSSSSSPSPVPRRNHSYATIKRSSSSLTSLEQSEKQTVQVNRKSKPPISLNNRQRKTESTQSDSHSISSDRKTERKKPTTLTIPSRDNDKALSEGFSADVSELSETQPIKSHSAEEFSASFLPILSSTDLESPTPQSTVPQPKRIYGPPQLSAMLSVSELLDSAYETPLDTHEETMESPRNSKSESLNIQKKKDSHSDSDNDDHHQNESNQSNVTVQFLRTLSSHVDTNQSDQLMQPMSALSNNSAPHTSIVDDATQALLARLGIMRQQQVERPESIIGGGPRERGNVEYFILVYLHSTPPDESTIKHLRSLVNFIKVFDDIDDCTAFINGVSNEKVICILSDAFSTSILSRIEDLQQVFTVYILTDANHEQINSDKQSKVKGYCQDIEEVYKQVARDINDITRDLIAYMNIPSNSSTADPMFIYCQLISEVILDDEETEFASKELISFARQEYEGNDAELVIIDEFENDYEKSRAIWWFTRQCFLSKMLNKALRVPEADVLFKLRLFIQHLHHQISNESISIPSGEDFLVYLGQTIHQNDLEDLQKNSSTNDLLVFSQFLSGTTDLSKAIQTARNLPTLSEEYIPVILHFNLTSNTKYANTSSLRYGVDDDNDVLLNIGLMGRIIQIEKVHQNQNNIASIYLTLVEIKNERILQQLLQAKRNEVKGAAPFVTLIK